MLKDELLWSASKQFNVAQFASFGPREIDQARHHRIRSVGERRLALVEATTLLADRAMTRTVNVRTFLANGKRGNPFHYGLAPNQAADIAIDACQAGFYVILNETIDVKDGGVSGVRLGGVTELAPGGTPRVVEGEDVFSSADSIADRIVEAIYGTRIPTVVGSTGWRVEFSIHPEPVGYRGETSVVWEIERQPPVALSANLRWPNRMSRHVGDKAFGLLVAEALGDLVPATLVLARDVPPFRFGDRTNTGRRWLRTSPREFAAGIFTTSKGWTDPYRLLAKEDPSGHEIASVLVQDAVDAVWSGAARTDGAGIVVEGVRGQGDRFMLGVESPDELPPSVASGVHDLVESLSQVLGEVRIEWVADRDRVWLLQLNQTSPVKPTSAMNEGEPDDWIEFDPQEGLGRLRQIIEDALSRAVGIHVTSNVGLTSHVGDLVRRAGVPTRFGG